MAISITQGKPEAVGHHREVVLTINFDASYPTGGEPIPDSAHGILDVQEVVFSNTKGYTLDYNKTTKKVLVYTAGAQVSNATDLSALTGVTARFKGN